MNHLDHPWIVCIGLLNRTALWQVGDASKKNGFWKMSISNFKRALVLFKIRLGFPPTITKTNIVPLCNRVFAKFFAEVNLNQHAIADRGWNPLNRALIFNTEILKTKIFNIVDDNTVPASPRNIFTGDQSGISVITSTSSVTSTSSAARSRVSQNLNLTSGSAGTIITDLLQYAMKEEGVNGNLKKRYAEGKILRG